MMGYVLMVNCFIEKSFSSVEKVIANFQTSLSNAKLEIPTEDPPVLLRSYAKRETLVMLYQNLKNGNVIFPSLRAGPETQHKELLNNFWTIFADANYALRIPGVTEFCLVKDSYRFYAKF
jgi:hypothetical protein